MIHAIMTGIIKVNIDLIVEIAEFNLINKAEVGPDMNKTTKEDILETIQGHIKILEDRITEENIEVTTGMEVTIEKEEGVGLEKGHF